MQKIVYIKPDRNTEVYEKQVILGQVAQVYCKDSGMQKSCQSMPIMTISSEEEGCYVCSVMELIKRIEEKYPQAEIQNLGESDFIVSYKPNPKRPGFFDWIKTVLVCLVVFAGAAFAIMTFNNDGDVTSVFGRIYELLMGNPSDGKTVLELGYSLGLPLGIIVFFNHFSGKQLTKDPTPIEVQMRLYENDVDTTRIQNAGRKEAETDVD
ncbi:MAG: stage V sporulation protein AA [Lachnospiraceae bacterium]|nr:stage V sporulation protein AA [Lachnospiraceae bacterium]